MSRSWSTDDARDLYSVAHWSEGYFDVGRNGHVLVRPHGAAGPALDLPDVVEAARGLGARLPLLVRFADILNDRRERLQGAFAKAMQEWDYAGGYTGVYPIKVNQQKSVAGELAPASAGFGLSRLSPS